ncbi:MAG: helix-turn-helix domain-containing protein [Acidimicrobiales bacterium]
MGETLRLLRHRARISRDELAETAGVSAGAISNYENDVSMPPARTLRRICWALSAALGRSSQELWAQVGLLFDQIDGSQESSAPGKGAE